METKITKTFSIILVIAMITGFGLFMPQRSKAVYYPFGGRLLSVTYCTCQYFPGALLTVGPPRGGQFLYALYASMPYRNYNWYSAGKSVLGLATAYAPCMQTAGYACVQSGGAPLVLKIGSSVY
jgi:hypothetical protein